MADPGNHVVESVEQTLARVVAERDALRVTNRQNFEVHNREEDDLRTRLHAAEARAAEMERERDEARDTLQATHEGAMIAIDEWDRKLAAAEADAAAQRERADRAEREREEAFRSLAESDASNRDLAVKVTRLTGQRAAAEAHAAGMERGIAALAEEAERAAAAEFVRARTATDETEVAVAMGMAGMSNAFAKTLRALAASSPASLRADEINAELDHLHALLSPAEGACWRCNGTGLVTKVLHEETGPCPACAPVAAPKEGAKP